MSADVGGSLADRTDRSVRHEGGPGQDPPDTRPEYVDFDVEDFPGGAAACLEAVLMASDHPLQAADLARVLALDESDVVRNLTDLAAACQGHGFELRRSARGWQLTTRPAYQPVVAAFVRDGQSSRLSQAALEALAIIAYRQPMTRSQVAQIRGVNSDGVVRSLLVRGLIREDGADRETHAALLTTTGLFLEQMGMDSLEELPSLAPFLPDEETALAQAQEGHGQEA